MKLLVVLLTFAAYTYAAEDESARLLVSKQILNQYLVEGKDLTVQYEIFNVGESAALSVELNDGSFPEADFEKVAGNLNAQWSRIAPGSNVTHSAILRPLKPGYFNFTAAEVSYLPSEDAKDRQVGYTSAPGEGGIINFKDYDRKFSPHVLDWAAFAVMTLPSLGIPFLLWRSSSSKYDKPKKQ